jgi:alcohol dehydrogenase class IV
MRCSLPQWPQPRRRHDRPKLPSVGGDFTWRDGERLIRFGPSALHEAPALLESGGFAGYALLTTERALKAVPALADAAELVAIVPSGPVPEAAAAVRGQTGGRPLVALGGGRVIDSAKAIAGADGLRCAAAPTTLSGAPFTPFHRMPAGVEEFRLTRPALVIAAPALMASQSMPQLAASAMNALAHAVESLYTPLANPISELVAVRAAAMFRGALSSAEPDRAALALASLLAGVAVGSTGFALHHALCQTTVRVLGTPHAETNAVLLPHSVRFVDPRAPEALAALAGALAEEPGGAAIAVAHMAARAGPTRLSELGVRREDLDIVAGATHQHPALANTPAGPEGGFAAPKEEELRLLLEGAL